MSRAERRERIKERKMGGVDAEDGRVLRGQGRMREGKEIVDEYVKAKEKRKVSEEAAQEGAEPSQYFAQHMIKGEKGNSRTVYCDDP